MPQKDTLKATSNAEAKAEPGLEAMADPQPTRLENVPLFQDLTPAQFAVVNRLARPRTFPAGTALITEEQPGEVMYVILSGTVKVFVQEDDGREVILALRGAGEVIGELSLVDGLCRSASVVSLEECAVIWIDRVSFWDEIWAMPPVSYNLTHILSRRLRLAAAQIQALAALDVTGRVARQLLAFAQEHGVQEHSEVVAGGDIMIPLRLTQNDLAGLVGASRVRVNQVLSSWKRQRYISIDKGHRLTIHNREALLRRCR